MGTFMGHVLPGSFFFGFAFWWCFKLFQEYYSHANPKSSRGGGRTGAATLSRYRNKFSHTCSCCCGRLSKYQLEGVVMLVVTTIGITGEVITGIKPDHFILGNAQHITMFFAFALVGLSAILDHHRVPLIVEGAVHALAVLALIVEAVLFNYHVHGRDDLDKHIHYLLVYTIIGCIGGVIGERVYPRSVVAGFARVFFFLLQGSWFVQVAFILYSPVPGAVKWNREKGEVGESIMLATLYYAWHMLSIAIGMGVVGALVFLFCQRAPDSSEAGYESTLNPLLHASENGKHHALAEGTDSEVDEFSQV